MPSPEQQTDEDPSDDIERRLAEAFSRIEQEGAPETLKAHARLLSGEPDDGEAAD